MYLRYRTKRPIIRTNSRLNSWTPTIKGEVKIQIIIIKNKEIALPSTTHRPIHMESLKGVPWPLAGGSPRMTLMIRHRAQIRPQPLR